MVKSLQRLRLILVLWNLQNSILIVIVSYTCLKKEFIVKVMKQSILNELQLLNIYYCSMSTRSILNNIKRNDRNNYSVGRMAMFSRRLYSQIIVVLKQGVTIIVYLSLGTLFNVVYFLLDYQISLVQKETDIKSFTFFFR